MVFYHNNSCFCHGCGSEQAGDAAELRFAVCRSSTYLSGLGGPNVDTEGLEGTSVALSLSPGKDIDL